MNICKSPCAAGAVALLLAGCAGIPYDPATNNDTTPPEIGLRIEGQDPASVYQPNPPQDPNQPWKSDFNPDIRLTPVDAGARVPGTPNVSVRVHENGEASVLATAQDKGSGIRLLKLSCQPRVYYNWDAVNQTESDAVLPVDVVQQNNQIVNGRVPASGVLQKVLSMHGLMVFRNAAGTMTRGHRVAVTCSAEASNFNGGQVYSQGVVVWAQDRSIQP